MGLLDALPWRRAKGVAPAKDDDLFDDDFQRKLEYLALVSRRVFAGRLRAERREWGSTGGGKPTSRRAERIGENLNKSLDRPSHSSPPPPVSAQRARTPSA